MRTSLIALSLAFSASVFAGPTDWMSRLDDNQPVRSVSIPGAHDAATSGVSISSAKCQSKSIADLFDSGVRAFDLRPRMQALLFITELSRQELLWNRP